MNTYDKLKMLAMSAMAMTSLDSKLAEPFGQPPCNHYEHEFPSDPKCDDIRKQKAEEKRKRKAEKRKAERR